MMIAKILLKFTAVLVLALGLLAGWVFYKWKDIGALEDFSTMEELNTMIADLIEREGVPGLAVAIVVDGDVAWSSGFGFANIGAQTPMTAETSFLIGSVSKIYTAIGLMQVVEAGQISLDTDINKYLTFSVDNPHIKGETITVRHLATHTSGIVDNDRVANGAYEIGDASVSLTDYLENSLSETGKAFDAGVNFAPNLPGTAFAYSNIGSSLAGELIEAATGVPLDEYTQASIFDVLGMTNTGWHLRDFDDPATIATPYGQSYWPWVIGEEYLKGNPRSIEPTTFGNRAFSHVTSPSYPMGGLRSSVNDQAKFLAAIINGGEMNGARIIGKETLASMFVPQFPEVKIDDSDVDIQGLFWALDFDGLWGHTGGDIGANNYLFFDPDTGIGGVISLNLGPTFKSLAVRKRVVGQIMTNQEQIRALLKTSR